MAGGIFQLITGSYAENIENANHRYIKPKKVKQKQRIKCFKKFKNFRKKDKYDQKVRRDIKKVERHITL